MVVLLTMSIHHNVCHHYLFILVPTEVMEQYGGAIGGEQVLIKAV